MGEKQTLEHERHRRHLYPGRVLNYRPSSTLQVERTVPTAMQADLARGKDEKAVVCGGDVCCAGDGEADYDALVNGVDCKGAEG